MSMLKGTYKKRNFSPSVYSLVFEPTTSADAIVKAIEEALKARSTTLIIRDRQYKGVKFERLGTLLKVSIENIVIRWESNTIDTISSIEMQIARFNKVKPCDYDKMKVIPFRYCSNLSRGGKENKGTCGQRLLIERVTE